MSYKINSLQVSNFRNLSDSVYHFSSNINCIFGNNGNGKTNLLEAIYFLSTKKSFRKKASFPQLLSVDCEEPEIIISSSLRSSEELESLSCKLAIDGTHWSIDGKPAKKGLKIDIVFINPFDSFSFHEKASFRRAFFDTYLGQYDKNYKKVLNRYNKNLRFKNALLSNRTSDLLTQIKVINQSLSVDIFELTSFRQKFLEELSPKCGEIFQSIFNEEHNLETQLDSKFIGMDQNEIFDFLSSKTEKELLIGHTKWGSHLDDYTLLFDGLNSYEFCSLGQQKMSYLSLLFAYISLFRYKFMSFPIVLIDDVSGELDQSRWQRLVDYLKEREFQVFITTANDSFRDVLNSIENSKKFFIQMGSLIEE